MNTSPMVSDESTRYQLSFRSLSDEGRGCAFPCDATGRVNIDELSDTARHNYLYARAVIGREFSMPAVGPALAQ
ncbi:hypothetical protein [Methylibium sp.]|uniref:hypothetical protein n=1 Tax=Methylibium sp. TaxID=2067992 RepID=UPI003D0FA511